MGLLTETGETKKLMLLGGLRYLDKDAANPFTPSAECWPSDKSKQVLVDVRRQLQRLGELLHFRTGLDTQKALEQAITNQKEWLKVVVK